MPVVLRADVYATAALLGSVVVMVAGRKLRLSPLAAAVLGGTVCFVLRMVSSYEHWNLRRVMAS